MAKKGKAVKEVNTEAITKAKESKFSITSLFAGNTSSDSDTLIVFDKKVIIFLVSMVTLYFIVSIAKLHTSSVGIWEQTAGVKSPKAIISGTPKAIRQDEWMISTPEFIGQYKNGFPIANTALGDGNCPVILGLPFKDFTMILRPNLWAYFVFDIERAFAFSWNFTIFLFIIGTFLLLLLLTGNNFGLSLFGALFIFSSSAMQWWSYWMANSIIYLNAIVISFVYLLFSKSVKSLAIAGIVLLMSSYSFLVTLYPPWQIPMLYLYFFIVLGYILKRGNLAVIKENLLIRMGVLSGVGIGLIVFGLHHYGLVKETYEILANTAYPGKRTTNGGDLVEGKLFSEFFGMFLTDTHVPDKWLNICEASGYIMFFPIVFYGIGYNYFKTKKTDWLLISVSVYILMMLVWLLLGFPAFLSKVTLLSMSPVYRTLPVFGVGNAILLFCYLGNRSAIKHTKFSWVEFGILAVVIFIFMYMVGNNINEATSNFFKSDQVLTACFLFTLVYLLIRFKDIKFATLALVLILIGINFSNFKINPLTSGLTSVTENPLVKKTKEYQQKDPEARWAIFGNPMLANLLKVNGINVFNGVKNVPLLKDMKVLDSTGKDNFIYNRFAHINMGSYINFISDTVIFKLNENAVVNDNYSIYMDPCSPRLEQLGIKYYLFTYRPKPAEIRCMNIVDTFGVYIYKRNN